jgi:hypothetical protein
MAGGSGNQKFLPEPKQNMAKSNPIKDPIVLELAKAIVKPTELWDSNCHARLIWKYFRSQGFAPTDLKAAGLAWDSFFANGSVAYASNCAKRLAEAGVCATPTTAEKVVAEYD